MSEGRNRQIRRTFAALGYTVKKLHRTDFGNYSATAMVQTFFAEDAHARLAGLRLCDGEQARMLRLMAEKGINTVNCISVGRLFDAVSAILKNTSEVRQILEEIQYL